MEVATANINFIVSGLTRQELDPQSSPLYALTITPQML
jgi:hypothetical protein